MQLSPPGSTPFRRVGVRFLGSLFGGSSALRVRSCWVVYGSGLVNTSEWSRIGFVVAVVLILIWTVLGDACLKRQGCAVGALRTIPRRFLLVLAPSASSVWLQHYPVGGHLWLPGDLQAEPVLRDGIDGEGAELVHRDAATRAVVEAEEDLAGVGWYQLAHQRG